MLGAIAGDIIGSVYEHHNVRHKHFELLSRDACFTDDTVLTVALADTILHGTPYLQNLITYYHRYPGAGFGGFFIRWVNSGDTLPYNSYGNGSAMRVSPVGFAFDDLGTILIESEKSAAVTHNHPEGIKGAQATAAAIWHARQHHSKTEIKAYIGSQFGYDLDRRLDEIRPVYGFNETCQETVPEAIIAFLESNDFEDAIRNAISIGGDSDTLACITGGIAEAYYGGVPEVIQEFALNKLDEPLKRIVKEFYNKYMFK
jgi:ADP-ribosylglycohydrolase